MFLAVLTNLSALFASVDFIASASVSSFLFWALAANSLARAVENLGRFASVLGGTQAVVTFGAALLEAVREEEAEDVECEAEEVELAVSLDCFLIL